MSKETFKLFARSHPELANEVLSNRVSWQKLYELYEIYGEEGSVWNNYLKRNLTNTTADSPATFKDVLNIIRNVDLESVQKGVSNIQKTIGLLQDIGIGKTQETRLNTYEPRPLYKYFED